VWEEVAVNPAQKRPCFSALLHDGHNSPRGGEKIAESVKFFFTSWALDLVNDDDPYDIYTAPQQQADFPIFRQGAFRS